MLVALDIQTAQAPSASGPWPSRYVTELVAALLEGAPEGEQLHLLVSPFEPVPQRIVAAARRSGATVSWVPLPLPAPSAVHEDEVTRQAYDGLGLEGATYVDLGGLERPSTGAICHPALAPAWAGQVGVLVHDVAPLVLPELYLAAEPGLETWYRAHLTLCAEADAVLVPSNRLSELVRQQLGEGAPPVHTVGLAPSSTSGPALARGVTSPPARVVWEYAPAPHRRPELIVEALAGLAGHALGDVRVDLATTPEERARLASRPGSPAGGPVGPAPAMAARGAVAGFLGNALAYVVPSCCEGYELAMFDAPLAGALVLAAEPVGGFDLLGTPETAFDPSEPAPLAALVRRAATDTVWREQLVARQAGAARRLTWEQVATRVRTALGLGVPGQAAPAPSRTPRRTKPAPVVLTGPLPPTASGITRYMVDQARAVAGHVATYWAGSQAGDAPGTAPGQGPAPSGALWWHHLANHKRFHLRQFDYLARHGGVVELHDIALPFLVPPLLAPPPDVAVPADLQAELRAAYPSRRSGTGSREGAGAPVGGPGETALLRWVARRADAFVVHSSQAAEMLRAALTDGPPVHVVPLGGRVSPEHRFVALSAPSPVPERPYLVVPGFVGPAKWPDGLIASVALVPADQRPLLVFAGFCPTYLAQRLVDLAGRRGVEMVLTGFLDDALFDTWLAHAAAALVGRRLTRGETSASVLSAARLGTPTIVAASAPIAELPAPAGTVRTVALRPVEVAREVMAVLWGPLAKPHSPERRKMFEASVPALRAACSWGPTVELLSCLAERHRAGRHARQGTGA